MFNTGSDLTPLEEHVDEFLKGLTEWQPAPVEENSSEVKTIEVDGDDYAEAYANVNERFLRNLWGDDLPIVPPTPELVDWILTGTEEDPDTILGTVPPRNGIATVRTAAISLAMAGGRPEYLPFIIAATKAMTDAEAAMQNWNATTNSVIPVFVVNGPVAHEIRLGSGYGLLGPDPVHPAGQIMGRTIRLMQQNLGGALPGSGTMALFGGMRATNAFFAEDDEGVPEGWTTWAEDRGYSRDQNVVTVTMALSMGNVIWNFGDEASNVTALNVMAATLRTPDRNRYSHYEKVTEDNKNLSSGAILIPRSVAESFVSANGLSKDDVKQYLWENSMTTYEEFEAWGALKVVSKVYPDMKPGDEIPVCPKPEQLTVLVAGGDQGGHGYYMGGLVQGNVVSAEVKLPSNWDSLILQSEIDLGAIPTTH